MSGESSKSQQQQAPAATSKSSETQQQAPAAASSCRKKKSDVNEGFVKDVISHIDEFVNASYEEHKTCLQKTVRKLFGVSKAVENSTAAPPPPVDKDPPLRLSPSAN